VLSQAAHSFFLQKKHCPQAIVNGRNAVAYLQVAYARADLFDDAHELVPHDVALFNRGNKSIKQVQVRTANRRSGHFDNRIVRIQDLRIVYNLCFDLALAHPADRLHRQLPSLPVASSCAGKIPGGVFIFSP